MKAGSTTPARSNPVGRGPKVRAAVLAATLAELGEQGYANLTVDNVARRAGVHKTTVYRRWKDRESLVVDAVIDHVATGVPVPDTGSIDTDLRQWARSLVKWLTSPTGSAVFAASMSDAAHLPEIAQAKRRFYEDRFGRAGAVVSRAVARGELPADVDPAELIKTLIAPIYLRLLITAEPIDTTTADHAAQVALVAARAGALSPRTSAATRRRATPSGRLEPVEADHRTGHQHEREPSPGIPIPPYLQPPEAAQPRQRPLHPPALPS